MAHTLQDGFRLMTLHERYSMFRQNLGYPQCIFHIITYPASELPSRSFLETRVGEIQDALPMMHARVVGSKTTKPGYVPGAKWAASHIVREAELEAGRDLRWMYAAESQMFEAQDREVNPMWTVTRVTTTSEVGYVMVSLNHLVIDGRGSTLLVQALLAPQFSVAPETWDGPTRCDDTISMKPSVAFFVPVVLRELVLPKFPFWVQSYFTKTDPWPAEEVKGSPLSAPVGFALAELDADTVAALKAAGKARGVATLHPLLCTAYNVAVWRVFGASHPEGIRLVAGHARDERDASLGHASIAHNYVSDTETSATYTGDDAFWDHARAMVAGVTGDAAIQAGRMTMGLLTHLPDYEADPSAADYDPKRPTGWEAYFGSRAEAKAPFRSSIGASNLGFCKLPSAATDWVWSQTASPFGSALYANFIGSERGVRLSTGWRDGCAATREQVDEVHRVWGVVLRRAAQGVEGSVAEISA